MAERWRPDPNSHDLLAAVLLADDVRAVDAWRRWRSNSDFQRVAPGSQRLVPLLHDRLTRIGVSHSDEDRYRAVHRYWWLRTSTQQKSLGTILSALCETEIEQPLVMGGMAMIGDIYPSAALRPTVDSDLLVRADDVPQAIATFRRLGFTPTKGTARALAAPWLSSLARRQSSIGLRHGELGSLRLWWQQTTGEALADARFVRARPLSVPGMAGRTLGPVDQLRQTCAQALPRSGFLPLWRFVDAALSLRKPGIDGSLLSALLHDDEAGLRLAMVLTYLTEEFDVPIPADALVRLHSMATPAQSRRQSSAGMSSRLVARSHRCGEIVRQYLQHRHISKQGSLLEFVGVTTNLRWGRL